MNATLTQAEQKEMIRANAYFPYHKVAGVKTLDGKFEVFAAATMAQENNYARKNNGAVFVLGA